jgi:predicted transcriptional regulator
VSKKISGKKRNRFAIVAEILSKSRTPAKKTHIMYKCNLSFNQLKYYLCLMREKGLIKRKKKSEAVVYQTTENGAKFLNVYSKMVQLFQT